MDTEHCTMLIGSVLTILLVFSHEIIFAFGTCKIAILEITAYTYNDPERWKQTNIWLNREILHRENNGNIFVRYLMPTDALTRIILSIILT